MSKATLVPTPAAPVSKLDPTDRTRATWRAAYSQARRMIRDRASHGAGAAYTWFLRHARRRFATPAGWRIAQAAGRLVFDRRTVGRGASGSVEHLVRQGLVRRTRRPREGSLLGVVAYRCATVERVRAAGLTFAWGPDRLAAATGNLGILRQRARELRAARAVAAGMAADRLAMAGARFAITPAGVAALRAAEAATA